MNGWIKLHRKMLEWEWFTEPDTIRTFLLLLLLANHEKTVWRGVIVNEGEVLTGRKQLALKLGIGEQRVRTALIRLKSTKELTIKVTSKFSLIKLNKWKDYQSPTREPTSRATNNQPATNHIQETKKLRNIRTVSKDTGAKPRKIVLLPHEKNLMPESIDHSFPRSRLYGDEKINWLLDYTEHLLDRKLAGNERWNRISAKHIANKIGMGKAKDLMDRSLVPENWWFDKITQMSTLYRNWDRITSFDPSGPKNFTRKTNVTII